MTRTEGAGERRTGGSSRAEVSLVQPQLIEVWPAPQRPRAIPVPGNVRRVGLTSDYFADGRLEAGDVGRREGGGAIRLTVDDRAQQRSVLVHMRGQPG